MDYFGGTQGTVMSFTAPIATGITTIVMDMGMHGYSAVDGAKDGLVSAGAQLISNVAFPTQGGLKNDLLNVGVGAGAYVAANMFFDYTPYNTPIAQALHYVGSAAVGNQFVLRLIGSNNNL